MSSTDGMAQLPDDARLWIYVAPEPLAASQQEALLKDLRIFLANWTSHGRTVRGAVTLLEDRFLALAAVVVDGEVSGCGIDASVHAVEAAGARQGVRWMSPLNVVYRDDAGQVETVNRAAFRQRVQAADVTAATPVFDLSITTLGALRAGQFEKPAGESWHARVFRIPLPAA